MVKVHKYEQGDYHVEILRNQNGMFRWYIRIEKFEIKENSKPTDRLRYIAGMPSDALTLWGAKRAAKRKIAES